MGNAPQLIVAGLANGSLYALLALGLALVYQVSGVVNFAQGALATTGAYVAWSLAGVAGLPFWAAVLLALAAAFVLGALLQVLLLRPLQRAPAAASLIVTLGLLSVIEGVIGQIGGYTRFFVLPGSVELETLRLGDVTLSGLDLVTIGCCLALIALFFAFLRWTRAGTALRAVAQTAQGARLVGVRVDRVMLTAWGLSAAVAAVAGVFIGGKTLMGAPTMADVYLLSAFAGAIIGGLDSLTGAAVGALLIGVVQNLVASYISLQWRDAVVFLLLLAVLLVRPSGVFGPVVQRRV